MRWAGERGREGTYGPGYGEGFADGNLFVETGFEDWVAGGVGADRSGVGIGEAGEGKDSGGD